VGQIYNVLIILAITLLMALMTTVLAYFVDLMPQVIGDNEAWVGSNNASISGSEAAQDN
jgi:hypothetical protein